MMTLAQFRARFPEFDSEETVIQAALDEAALEIDEDTWGTRANTGHGYLTAHKLATSPFGQQARLQASGEPTTYLQHYISLRDMVTCGLGRTT